VNEKSQGEIIKANSQIWDLELVSNNLNSQLQILQKENSDLKREIEIIRGNFERCIESGNQLKQEVVVWKSKYSHLDATNKSLESSLSDAKLKAELLTSEIETKTRLLSEESTKNIELLDEISRITTSEVIKYVMFFF
jgi:chromosome segregation ATPase